MRTGVPTGKAVVTMTGREKVAVKVAAERIKYLAEMEHTSLFDNTNSSMSTEAKVRCYMQWFEIVAKGLERLADAETTLEKESAFKNLNRYCND